MKKKLSKVMNLKNSFRNKQRQTIYPMSKEVLRTFLINLIVRSFTAYPRGGEFDFEEFKDELENDNIDIIGMKCISNSVTFSSGRKR